MIVLLYYKIKGTPHEERKIPGLVAGIVDVTVTYGIAQILWSTLL